MQCVHVLKAKAKSYIQSITDTTDAFGFNFSSHGICKKKDTKQRYNPKVSVCISKYRSSSKTQNMLTKGRKTQSFILKIQFLHLMYTQLMVQNVLSL